MDPRIALLAGLGGLSAVNIYRLVDSAN